MPRVTNASVDLTSQHLGTPGAAFYRRRVALAVLALSTLAAAGLTREPRFALVFSASVIVQAHLYFALAAFGLGAVQLAAKKGGTFHKVAGWTWVTMIGIAMLTSCFIMIETPGSWSWIHTTTIVHGITLALAVFFAVRRNIRWHARLMAFTYVSGLIGAFMLAFIPERLMWQVFFG